MSYVRLMRAQLLAAVVTGSLLAVPAAAQEPANSETDSAAFVRAGRAGEVVVSVSGVRAPIGAGVRVGLTRGLALDVALDRATFAGADPTTRASPFVASGARAWTLSATLDPTVSVSAASWFTFGSGVQAYARRQRDDVVIGYDGGTSSPIVDEGGRRVEQAGIAPSLRVELRPWERLRLGYVSGYFGLGVQRTRGGTVEDGGDLVRLEPGETRTRVVFGGGSSRFYVGVRL